MKNISAEQLATRVSVNTIIANTLLTIFKLAAGIVSHSAAMISDAVHSASDVFSTIIVIIGVRLANKRSDADHQYGHERLECVAAVILSVMLAATGAAIGFSGIKKIAAGGYIGLSAPGRLALWAAIISIIVKEAMYWYTRATAKKINSGALMADAWHHRSDALSSIGSFVGILGARLGFPILDCVASVIISVFIIKVAVDIFRDAMDKMTDKACDKKTEDEIRRTVLAQRGVLGIDDLKTRRFGDKIYIDIEILADGNLPLIEAHEIAERVHSEIEAHFPTAKHCMVHVNPKI